MHYYLISLTNKRIQLLFYSLTDYPNDVEIGLEQVFNSSSSSSASASSSLFYIKEIIKMKRMRKRKTKSCYNLSWHPSALLPGWRSLDSLVCITIPLRLRPRLPPRPCFILRK